METRRAPAESAGTVSGLLSRGRRDLGWGGEASLEAEVLLGHVLGRGREWLHAHSEEIPGEADRMRFLALVRERAETGCPIAYLTGFKEFHGIRLAQARGVLIPRPETEELVDFVLARLEKTGVSGGALVVDAGCGCGAIGIALAVRAGVNVAAIDVSENAVELAGRNAASCSVSDKVRVLRGSWLEPIAFLDPVPEVIAVVSNPPYVRTGEIGKLPRDILLHEPRIALNGGEDGLDSIRSLAAQAGELLAPAGFLAFEFGEDQEEQVVGILARAGWRGIETGKDLAGKPRFAAARPRRGGQ